VRTRTGLRHLLHQRPRPAQNRQRRQLNKRSPTRPQNRRTTLPGTGNGGRNTVSDPVRFNTGGFYRVVPQDRRDVELSVRLQQSLPAPETGRAFLAAFFSANGSISGVFAAFTLLALENDGR
jgi:hypothetical protein